jgi:hypothetical protein
VGKYKKRPTMRVMLTRIDGGACDEGSSVRMPWPSYQLTLLRRTSALKSRSNARATPRR